MSVRRDAPGQGRREGTAGDSRPVPEAAHGGQLHLDRPGQRADHLPARAVAGAVGPADQPAPQRGHARPVEGAHAEGGIRAHPRDERPEMRGLPRADAVVYAVGFDRAAGRPPHDAVGTGLGNCLADEQADRTAREKSIEVLFDIYQRDLQAENSLDFAAKASDQLVKYTKPLERTTIAVWIHDILTDEDEKVTGSRRQAYGGFLLALEKDTLDDATYLQICRETGRTSELVDRLLALGRVDEAVRETQKVDDNALHRLVDLFIQHGQDAVAERLVKERITERPAVHFLEWLQGYYRDRDNHVAELEMTETLFRTEPSLRRYQELRSLATRLGRWETLRPEMVAYLEQGGKTRLLIQIALDEGEIDKALQLLKGMAKKDSYGYTYDGGYGYYGYSSNIALDVAAAAEETRPREAIDLYRQYAERLIAMRDRKNYQAACTYLLKMRALYEKLGENEAWTGYITALREQNRNLRALKEELARARL